MQEMLALILTENSVFQGTQRNLWLRDLFLVCCRQGISYVGMFL